MGDKLQKNILQQIRRNMDEKSTEELLKIWKENDITQFSDEAFEIIKVLIEERGSPIPPQLPKKRDLPNKEDFEDEFQEYSNIENLPDEELIEILQNSWNYPKSYVSDVEQEIKNRGNKLSKSKPEKYSVGSQSKARSQPINNNEGFSLFLEFIGYVTIVVGLIVAIALLGKFSQSGFFSSGKIGFPELLIAFSAFLYHLVFGMLSSG